MWSEKSILATKVVAGHTLPLTKCSEFVASNKTNRTISNLLLNIENERKMSSVMRLKGKSTHLWSTVSYTVQDKEYFSYYYLCINRMLNIFFHNIIYEPLFMRRWRIWAHMYRCKFVFWKKKNCFRDCGGLLKFTFFFIPHISQNRVVLQ